MITERLSRNTLPEYRVISASAKPRAAAQRLHGLELSLDLFSLQFFHTYNREYNIINITKLCRLQESLLMNCLSQHLAYSKGMPTSGTQWRQKQIGNHMPWLLLLSAEGVSVCSRQWRGFSYIHGTLSSDTNGKAEGKHPKTRCPQEQPVLHSQWKELSTFGDIHHLLQNLCIILTSKTYFHHQGPWKSRVKPQNWDIADAQYPYRFTHNLDCGELMEWKVSLRLYYNNHHPYLNEQETQAQWKKVQASQVEPQHRCEITLFIWLPTLYFIACDPRIANVKAPKRPHPHVPLPFTCCSSVQNPNVWNSSIQLNSSPLVCILVVKNSLNWPHSFCVCLPTFLNLLV